MPPMSDERPLGAVALEQWLRREGLTAYRFALDNNLNPKSMSQWLSGQVSPRIKAAAVIQRATGGTVTIGLWE